MSAGTSDTAITAMPNVAPRLSSSRNPASLSARPRDGSRPFRTLGTVRRNPMMTTLASTGAHAGAKKRRRACRSEEPRAISP